MTPQHRAWVFRMIDLCASRAAALDCDPHPSAPMRAAVLRSMAQAHRAQILGLAPAAARTAPAAPPASPPSSPGEQMPLFEMTT